MWRVVVVVCVCVIVFGWWCCDSQKKIVSKHYESFAAMNQINDIFFKSAASLSLTMCVSRRFHLKIEKYYSNFLFFKRFKKIFNFTFKREKEERKVDHKYYIYIR